MIRLTKIKQFNYKFLSHNKFRILKETKTFKIQNIFHSPNTTKTVLIKDVILSSHVKNFYNFRVYEESFNICFFLFLSTKREESKHEINIQYNN